MEKLPELTVTKFCDLLSEMLNLIMKSALEANFTSFNCNREIFMYFKNIISLYNNPVESSSDK